MKFNYKCVSNMCRSGIWFLMLVLLISCGKTGEEILFEDQYPALYEAVYERKADSLLAFTQHQSDFVQQQAWRALISTPISDSTAFFNQVLDVQHRAAWVALSRLDLNDTQIQQLQDIWKRVPSLRDDINVVLGRQGNEQSLNFLIRNMHEILDSGQEYEYALAIGRMIGRLEINAQSERVIVQHAAIQDDPDIMRAYLYGYYRFGKKIENERLQNIVWETFQQAEDPKIRQYALRISFINNPNRVINELKTDEISDMNVQLTIELAQLSQSMKWSDKLADIYRELVDHENPVVNEVALTQLNGHNDKPDTVDEILISSIITDTEKEASVRLSGILALNERDTFLGLADSLAEEKEYLIYKKLNIYKEELPHDEFLEYLHDYFDSENRLHVLFGTQVLGEWWNELSDRDKTSQRIAGVKNLLSKSLAMHDRSITYIAQPLLMSPEIAEQMDFPFYQELLKNFALPEDVEVYQAISAVLYEHYEEEAQSLIDSLALAGNTALNSRLIQQGWNIQAVETENKIQFKEPNWDRLIELGFDPIWVLETEKGIIKIEMNTVIAPATISAMDSLITTGEYDGVAFHRVAPNFVIQGGDVETGDGFGGPNYVVPTESSEIDYQRGTVGIASAGTDTEGSQYFIMHQWAPHLNSRYTVIGKVIEGMDVVDRIMIGDKVIRSYWEEE